MHDQGTVLADLSLEEFMRPIDGFLIGRDGLRDGLLYQRHNTGRLFRYTGTPLTGWQELDNNPATYRIAAGGGQLYQIRDTGGEVWRYTFAINPFTGTAWEQLHNTEVQNDLVAVELAVSRDRGTLYQRDIYNSIWYWYAG
jgi:hypothetical protein